MSKAGFFSICGGMRKDNIKFYTWCFSFLPKVLNPAKDGAEGEVVVEEGDEGADTDGHQAQATQLRIF